MAKRTRIPSITQRMTPEARRKQTNNDTDHAHNARTPLEAWSEARGHNARNVNGDKRRTHTYLQHNILVGGFLLSVFDLHVDRRPPLLHRRDAAVPVGAGVCTRDAKSVQDSATAPRGVTGSTGLGHGLRGKRGGRLWKHDRNHIRGTCRTWNTQWPYLRLASVLLPVLPLASVAAHTAPTIPNPLLPDPRTLACPATPTRAPTPAPS